MHTTMAHVRDVPQYERHRGCPILPPTILALDPGAGATGYAVLSPECTLRAHGVLRPRTHLAPVERQLWYLAYFQNLISIHQPQVLTYETFDWREGQDNGSNPRRSRTHICWLIGGIQGLSLQLPYPALWTLEPGTWYLPLLKEEPYTKQAIAAWVNLRLGTTYMGNEYDNDEAEATAMALVVCDALAKQPWEARRNHL